jgi:hypothetical protein
MANASEPADMPIDGDVVRGGREHQIGAFVVQEAIEGPTVAGITAQKTMTIKEPQVCRPGHRCAEIDQRRYLVVRRALRMGRRLPCFIEHHIDFGKGEASDLYVKVQIDDGLQFDREQV